MNLKQLYVIFHEVGHAVAAFNSKSFDVGKIVFAEGTGHLEPVWRDGVEIEVSPTCLLEKAMIACSGGAAGGHFLDMNRLPPDFRGHEEGLNEDFTQCYDCLTALGMGQEEANELIGLTFEYFEREDVWNLVTLLSDHISNRGLLEISGAEVRALLSKHLSSYGTGLPVLDQFLNRVAHSKSTH